MAGPDTRTARPFDRRAARAQRFVTALHTLAYRLTGGRLGGWMVGSPVLLLFTIGRKTGRLRITPLFYLADGPNYVLVASNGGTAGDPAWFRNLQARPRALVQIGQRIVPVRAEVAESADRARLWPRLTQMYSGYAGYQQRTPRKIPVVLLQPMVEADGAA